MQHANFVHLHVHTQYSLLDGAIKVGALVDRAKEYRMPAMAITDHGNMFGALEFYTKAHAAGVKPIIGCEVYVAPGSRHEKSGASSSGDASGHLVLLCKNRTGYRNLCRLVSTAYQDGFYYRPRIDWDLLSENNEGLIALTACLGGEIPSLICRGRMDHARLRAEEMSRVFDNNRLYLELQENYLPEQETANKGLITLSKELGLPLVATNDCHYLTREDAFAHEVLLCIQTGKTMDDPNRMRFANEEFYVKTPEEMSELFKELPEAVSNSVEIAERCNLELDVSGKTYHFPALDLGDGLTPAKALEKQSFEGLEQRIADIRKLRPDFSAEDHAAYKARLEQELKIINQMGFPDYFLIVADFINWAKDHDIPVGPGRGSAAGSLVAYALKITDIDPKPYHLLFERFLNPERISMPDIDVDFCINGREDVINYVRNKYGNENVAQIITFGSMLARAVIRDVGRGMGMAYGEVDTIAKLIPNPTGKKVTLQDAQKQEPRLRELIEKDSRVKKLFNVALSLEGLTRHASTHAAGVVVTPEPLTNYLPLYVDPKSHGQVTQFDMGYVEKIGLVKFDFLGLKTLTVIDKTVKLIKERQPDFDLGLIPQDDAETFQLLSRGETTGVFQLESSGMKEYLIKLKPSCFEDMIAMVALYRPGPLGSGMVDSFIKRKHGVEEFGYDFPQLEPILRDTYGVIVYQEQVMQIAQVLGNYSLGGADLLRRAMGKKKPEEMAKVREQFLSGCSDRGVDGALADQIFDLMEKFSGYAFNKSHSATYALVSFQTAWLKTHHPAEFMAATLSADMQNTDKVVTLVDEVRGMGLPLIHPSVNRSQYRFSATDGAVVYGLGAVRGVGEGPVQALMEARAAGGEFASLPDFCRRVDSRKANRRVLEALIRAGAMDDFAEPGEALDCVRARLMAELGDALQGAEQAARDVALGMSDMFGGLEEPAHGNGGRRAAPVLGKRERLEWEKEALGLYLSGHPIEDYLGEIREFCGRPIADLEAGKRTQVVAGLVFSARSMRGRRGEMGFVVLDDRSKRIEVSLFSEVYLAGKEKVVKDAVLVVEGEVQPDDYTGELKMRADNVYNIEEARRRFARELVIDCCDRSPAPDFSSRLKTCLEPFRDGVKGCSIAVVYKSAGGSGPGAKGRIVLGRDWAVSPCDDLLLGLRAEFGDDRVAFRYAES